MEELEPPKSLVARFNIIGTVAGLSRCHHKLIIKMEERIAEIEKKIEEIITNNV